MKPPVYRAFTLVELLVVIGIITVLIAILLPVFSAARERANRVVCLSNLHQLGMSFIMYAAANHGQLPACNPEGGNTTPDANPDLVDILLTFANGTDDVNKPVENPRRFWCPSSNQPAPNKITTTEENEPESCRISYDFYSIYWNSDLGPKLNQISDAPLAWDGDGGDPVRSDDQNHGNKGGNVVFTDGHAAWQPQPQWDGDSWPHPAKKYFDDAGN